MTRLTTSHISGLIRYLADYDEALRHKTGCTLKHIALHAAGLSEQEFANTGEKALFRVVPITSGQGAIPGFCEAIRGIIAFLGCEAEITSRSDVSGFAEAFRSRADCIFCADDNDFVSFNINTKAVIHNDAATAKAYVTALRLQIGPFDGKVLVLGCGPLGRAVLSELLLGNQPAAVYDPDRAKADAWYHSLGSEEKQRAEVLSDFPQNLEAFTALVDATPASDIIEIGHMHDHLFIAAPGVPLGVTQEAYGRYSHRVIHDPLQLGVATMVALSGC